MQGVLIEGIGILGSLLFFMGAVGLLQRMAKELDQAFSPLARQFLFIECSQKTLKNDC